MKYILGASDERTQMGGKASALASLQVVQLPIPAWFVVSPAACPVRSGEGVEDLKRLMPGEAASSAILAALDRISPAGEPVAVRSSAIDEDGKEHSFAGQLDSFLFVDPAEVPQKVAEVWRSGFSERVLAYRRERNLGPPSPPAVLVQRMVQPESAGVAFSADPITGQRGIAVVSAVYGLGTSLVSGECDADTWRVGRSGAILERRITEKRTAHVRDTRNLEGVSSAPIEPELAGKACLSDDQVRNVAELARKAGLHFGRPQDIEWAFEGGKLFLLQSRPITSLAAMPDPDGFLQIWDNSNIAESYGGVTTPLTFSFARHVYEEVYRQFCRIMAVPQPAIEANENIFPRMLGLVRGRVYYNLINWYRLLAMLPGFSTNRRFMEQMMGVKEGIPDTVLDEALSVYRVNPLQDRIHLARSIGGLLSNHLRLSGSIGHFYERLQDVLKEPDVPLQRQRPDELVGHYRMLESRLLRQWDAPLVNDFFAMVFYGLLGRTTSAWCGDRSGTLRNELLTGEGGIISTEPARRVREMGEVAAADNAITELLATGDPATIASEIARHPRLGPMYASYLGKFGDRCLDELKLESATLHDDPLPLQRSIGELARRIRAGRLGAAVDESAVRRAAENRAEKALAGKPVKKLLFFWILKHARERVRNRENLRFERTRLFGRVRRIFTELGARFAAEGILDDARDIFWLNKEEILGFVDGTSSSTDLCGLAALRKAEFSRWKEGPPPADRFETRGIVNHSQPCRSTAPPSAAPAGNSLQGIGCCAGTVRGQVRVISDPRGAVIRQGEILVAERTDPGWIMLFPACSGLLVERGSLLSHSAIVAREMGIPAVVSLTGITSWLKDGDWG